MGKIKNKNEGRNGNPFLTLLTILVVVLPALFLMPIQTEAAAPFDTWNSVSPPPTTGSINAITYGDGKVVAVGGSKIFISTNGMNGSSWTTVDLGGGINLNAVVYGKSMFVVVGSSGNLYTSSDGYTWTQRFPVPAINPDINLRAISYGNERFVAVGDNGSGNTMVVRSSDGINWVSAATFPAGHQCILNGITFDANKFVAVGRFFFTGPSPTAAAFVSSDGFSWTVYEMFPSIPTTIVPAAVTYGNGYFVAVAPGMVFTSMDGQHWGRQGTSYNLRGVANAYIIFVAVGDGGTLVTFTDPTNTATWTTQVSGTSNNLSGVDLADDTRFFVVGDGTILYSGPFGINLAVTKPGTGTGTVRSLPPGINCGSDCSEHYDAGTVVTLTAAPDAGSYFAGWSGDCVSQALTCKVTMNAAKNVTATFTTGTPTVTTWAKTYGGSGGDDYATSIQQTSDGGYIVAGYTMSFGAGNHDLWVLKLNADGSIAWQKTYGGSGDERADSIQQTSDGGYIVAGYTMSFGAGYADLWVLKLNADGTVAWQNTYGGQYDDEAYSIQQTSDGGYIVAGSTGSFGAGNLDIWVLKLNTDGSIAWQSTYGGSSVDEATTIQQTSDGGYIVAGDTMSFGAGNLDLWVLKLNADGSIAWQKTYGGSSQDQATSIQQTSDGGYIVAGYTMSFGAGNFDIWVLKLNADGSIAWQKTYAGSGGAYGAWAYSIQQTSDGGYIVAGGTDSFGAGYADLWVLKLNADGSIAWQKTYGGWSSDVATSIQQTSDGGYIVAGGTASFGAGSSDLWVLKLDSNGNISGCPGGLIGTSSAVVGSPTITITTPTPTIGTTSATINDTNATIGTPTVVTGEVCTGIPPSYTLNVTSNPSIGGTVVINPPGGPYAPGTPVQIQANFASGYFFYQWSGDLTGSTNPVTITMDANKTITANFLLTSGDSNGDGLPDGWEMANFGTLAVDPNGDPDNDGLTNLQEYQLGTNPNSADQGIAGRITDQTTGEGLWVKVDIYRSDGTYYGSAYTDSNGYYKTSVPSGQYKLDFYPWFGIPYAHKWFNNKLDFSSADLVSVTQNQMTIADGQLEKAGRIAGKVTDLTSGAGIPNAEVFFYINDVFYMAVGAGSDGTYGAYVPQGELKIKFRSPSGGYVEEWFDNKIDIALADLVPVLQNQTTTINAQLSPKYTFDQDLIDRTIWADLEFVRRINNGALESAFRAYGTWANNHMSFSDPNSVFSIKSNVKVTQVVNEGAWLRARLAGNFYSDSPDSYIDAQIGIKHTNTDGLVGYYGVTRCFDQECGPNSQETVIWVEKPSGWVVSLNETKNLSIGWNGSTQFTFEFAGNQVIVDANNPSLPKPAPYYGPTLFPFKGLDTRVSHPDTPTSGGFIRATFDNVFKNGASYNLSGADGMIDRPSWNTWEFVRQVNNGVFESALTRYGSNGSNNMSFVNSQAILGFEADLKVVEFQNTGARPMGRLYANLYNDGTGNNTPGDLKGDVTVSVGILDNGQGLGPQAFYSVSHCLTANCNLPGEYEILYSGFFKNVGLNETHRFSISWNGLNVTLGCDGSPISYNPTSVVANAGPPKGRKGIGTRVTEISSGSEWAYVAASFDNVVVTEMDSDLDGLPDSWEIAKFGTLTYGPSDDPDHDGLTNLQEYQLGTNPNSPDYKLTVTKSGTGDGTITRSPLGIDYLLNQYIYAGGTPVTLTATASVGSFIGWTGYDSVNGNQCTVTMNTAKSVTATFALTAPPAPTLAQPTSGATEVDINPQFSWNTSTGADSYELQISTDGRFSTIVFDQSGLTATSQAVNGLLNNKTYYWRVNATNAQGTSDWSPIQSFTTVAACPTPGTPLNPSPTGADIPTSGQTLTWAPCAEANSYDAYFGTSTNPLFVGNVIGTSYALPTLNPNTTYYWKIVAKNNCGNSSTGSLWSFKTIITAPSPPTLSSPSNGETGVVLSPTLVWNAPPGAINSYHLQVSTDNFSTFVFNGSVTGTSQTLTGPLLNDTTYSWRVNATNNIGTSDWSDAWTFITQPPYGNLFIGVRGVTDPDNDGDGIDDDWEKANLSDISPNYKTLFVRPKQEIGLNQFQYWPGFIALFPDTRHGAYSGSFADIPPLTKAGIEVVVIGPTCCTDPNNPATCTYIQGTSQCHKYEPFDHFDYNPANDSSHPNCDILELVYKMPTAYCTYGSQNAGHTFFSASGLVWSWDTKGYTPSTAGPYGYKTPQIYPFPLDNYFNEGAYQSIAATTPPQSPSVTSCTSSACTKLKSPLNLNSTDSVNGLPDATVEFNPIAFDSSGKIISITTPLPTTGYDRDTVLRRTIVHEMGHALLAGLDSDHCADPNCIMYASAADWQIHDFGPGDCVHKPGGSKDIRAAGVIHNSVHGVVATPVAPTLASPTNGATGVAINPTLSWNASSGATSYGLQVSTVSDFSTTVVNQSTITSTSYAVSGLPNSTTFYWRVNATNSGGTSDWSTVWSFTTAPPPPAAPTLASPASGATGLATNPTLSWNASAGATSYGLQVSTTSSFSTTVVNQTGIQNTSYPASGLANSTTYYWRVNATNAGGTSAWSAVWSFTTLAVPPAAPTLSSPASGATGVSVTPTLAWNASTGATSYGLQVSTSSSFSTTVVNQTGITGTSYAVPPA